MPVYSIVIPHKNIPDLLKRCLASIPSRDDLEIIVVDDNSDSNIVDFKKFPGLDRQDVQVVFDKIGGGGGHARNIGLSKATGKWVMFVDADDFFNYCINDVLDQYKDSSSDITFFKANSVDSETYEPRQRAVHLNGTIDSFLNNEPSAELSLRYLFGEPWCRLIRRSLIVENHINFEETSIHNDTAFAYKVGHVAKTISVDKRCIYTLTYRSNSVSVSISEKKKLERIQVFCRAKRFFVENGIEMEPLLNEPYRQLAICKIEGTETYQQGYSYALSQNINESFLKRKIALEEIKVRAKKVLKR